MRASIVFALSAGLLVSCAGVTDVVSTGPGIYMVAAEGVAGNSSSGKQAFKAQEQAAAFCSKQGKQVDTVSNTEQPGGFGKVASATVTFRCVEMQK